ncbi:MAG: AEC family transporter [Gammaproteobacteria bacterium]|nr:AEC family transporter [Gammaproteobacteria bacterium]
MSTFIVISICIFAGILLRRSGVLPDNASVILNQYVIWIALPALVLTHIPSFNISAEAWLPVGVAWSMVIVSAIIVVVFARLLKWSASTQCVLLLLVPLGNTSFVGIPMLTALIGEASVPIALLYDQLGSFLALATYGSIIVAVYSGEKVTINHVVIKVMTFPPFIALLVALLMNVVSFHSSNLTEAFSIIGNTLVPVVMVAVGFQWQFKMSNEDALPMVFGLSIKLLIAPLLVYIALDNVELSQILKQSIILESAMAPMISAGALAILANQRPQLVAAMIGYGLLAAFISVPMWYWVIS